MKAPPQWLAEFQKDFGSVLREPLASESGALESILPESARKLDVEKFSRISDYHRQYWIRFFQTMQTEFPLTSRLVGLWKFNLLVQKYLRDFPPTEVDLQRMTRHFSEFLSRMPDGDPPKLMLQQAAEIDSARQQVFLAADFRPWSIPTAGMSGSLKLKMAPDARIVWEHWCLVDRVLNLHQFPGETAIPLPNSHDIAQAWLIKRQEHSLCHRPLPRLQARLYEWLDAHDLGTALEYLQKEALDKAGELPAFLPQWMSQGVDWGLWSE